MATTTSNFLLMVISTCLLLQAVLSQQDATVSFSIREELPDKTYIGSVALKSNLFTNTPNEKFQRLQFQISTHGNTNADLFDIETNTSLLWTKISIDREKIPGCAEKCVVDLNVVVYDLDLEEFTKLIKILVTVDDYNDNEPTFMDIQQPLKVSETTKAGSTIATGAVEDLDQGKDNSVSLYRIVPESQVFGVKMSDDVNTEFVIVLNLPLDREMLDLYQIVIEAMDGGTPQLTGTLTLDIVVTDVNDNFPTFLPEEHDISVYENVRINSTVLVLYANDIDSDDNGKISFAFGKRVSDKIKNTFKINDTTGELTVSDVIDYETDKKFKFQIEASDHGNPPKSSTAEITINVKDRNDNAPEININQPPGGTILSELAGINTYVALVEIIDTDSGANGKVSCEVLDDHFRLELFVTENKYKIVVNRSLDHDVEPTHNVTIICADSGDEPLQSIAHFIVHVEDQNDNYPIFSELVYNVTIEENNERGEHIVDVSATDLDSGNNGEVSYSLSYDAGNAFVINSSTGIITANVSLDRETLGEKYEFDVLAIDKGDPVRTSTATVIVNILDQNDNAPIFFEPRMFNVTEREKNETVVGRLNVNDPDKGVNGTFQLILPTNESITEYFRFESNGLITTRKELDRENIAFHQFYVEAVDGGGRTSSALYLISVNDVNDNNPEILYPSDYNNEKLVPVTQAVGSEVLQIHGRDFDSEENATLHYTIDQDNSTSAFTLNEHTGKMFLNSTLAAVDIGTVFSFVIRVRDGGKPPLSTWTTLNLRIIEGNKASQVLVIGQTNLWIVIAIVSITAILSLIMVAIIVKMYMSNRRKGSGNSSDIMIESNEVNPRLIDSSSSSSSTSSKDSNGNEKLKIQDGSLQLSTGFLHPIDQEKGSVLDTSLVDSERNLQQEQNFMYMEKVKQLGYELSKKIDETNSDNSGELGTRDSGQGGSDVDMNSLSELPVLEIPECASITDTNSVPSPRTYFHNDLNPSNKNNNLHSNRSISSPSCSDHSKTISEQTSEQLFVPKSMANFTQPSFKTAERKELSRLRKNQKRVMFSDDLENSHSSGRSSAVSSLSFTDINSTVNNVGSPRQLNRMYSDDPSSRVSEHFKPADLLRRSVDNLSWHRNGADKYKQSPSNKNNSNHSAINNFQNRSFDISSGSSEDWKDVDRSRIFSLSREYPKSSSSRDTESTTSGSYSLTLDDYASSPGTDNVFPKDLYV